MVGFKAKAWASAYLTKLGWRCGCILWVGCVWGGGYICLYGWGVSEGCECIGKEGEEKPHHYIIFVTLNSLVHEKIYPINLIKMTKIENKIASVQNKKKSFIYNKNIILPKLTLIS